MATQFNYETAFDRNIGWLTDWEQQTLRFKCVAIAGMGGVGGVHLLTLARLGIGAFHIADLDRFDLPNMNRQVGATMSTLGQPKVDVLSDMVRDINPEARVVCFRSGVTPGNVAAFLDGVDLFVDGFDFFALDIRQQVFAASYKRGIPAITAAPIGMGAGMLVFLPGKMSFETYFRLSGHPEPEQYLRFLMGVAPRGLHRPYLVDPSRVDLQGQRGPSTGAACQICAGMVTTEAVKLLLRRGRVRAAPYHQHFDAYRGKLAVSWLPFGANGPMQRLKRSVARRVLDKLKTAAPAPSPVSSSTVVEDILVLARWAPSGDNEQPWRFLIEDGGLVRIALTMTPGNVYEYRDSQPVVLAAGMLLESIRVAASAFGHRMEWHIEAAAPPIRIVVRLTPEPGIERDPLCASLASRSVDRSAYRMRRLSTVEKAALAAALGSDLQVAWHEAPSERLRLGRLGARASDIRLRMPETFAIHNAAVDWRATSSEGGIPASALGLPGPFRWLMRWASRDWGRMNRLNRLGGTLTAGLLDGRVARVAKRRVFLGASRVRAGPCRTPRSRGRDSPPAVLADGRKARALDAAGAGHPDIRRLWRARDRIHAR